MYSPRIVRQQYQSLKDCLLTRNCDDISLFYAREIYALKEVITNKDSLNNFYFKTCEEPLLFVAIQLGDKDKVSMVLSWGFAANIYDKVRGFTALHLAAQEGNKEIVELLLNNGADIEARNKDGLTPLDLAHRYGYKAVKEILLNKLQQIYLKKGDCYKEPLVQQNKIPYLELKKLIEEYSGDNINIRNILEERGYEPNIDYYELTFKYFNSIDLSELSAKNSVLYGLDKANRVNLQNSNLSNCRILKSVLHFKKINFTGTILTGTIFACDEGILQALTPEQLNNSHLLAIENNAFFRQIDLIQKYSKHLCANGECRQVTLEYIRCNLNSIKKQKPLNAIEKLQNYLKANSTETKKVTSFLQRISSFRTFPLQSLQLLYSKTVIAEGFINCVKKEYLEKYRYLEIFYNQHSVPLHIEKDASTKIRGYKFFDPNYGETPLLQAEQLNKVILTFIKLYWNYVIDNSCLNDWIGIGEVETSLQEEVSDEMLTFKKPNAYL